MIRLGNASIQVLHALPTTQEVDLLVIPANTYLWMKHGAAGSVKREGGDGIEREALAKGPVPLGGVVFTGSGSLPCGRIAHAAVMAQDLKATKEWIRLAVSEALKVADKAGVESVAMPPMASGAHAPPPEVVAGAMFEPMIELLPDAQHIREIRICVPDEELLRVYRAVLGRFFAA